MSGTTPFSTLLVANRGEIALRVMRTARRLGYRTVAVYSEADADAAHVMAADRAACIGGPLPAQSYLDIEAVLAAARRTGADAIHPGYGFLAENAGFAEACAAAGLVFVGPSPEAIRAMGDKAGAKRLMEEAGVPCIPGYQGEDQSAGRLAEEAGKIGFPLMIKAAAGGGGRGMRLCERQEDFASLLRAARSEALNAFGDDTVILERAVAEPRHVEIQVFADRHGHVVHLGERDCSVQRRHQKLIEEAPSPAVDPVLRARMGEAAVAAAQAIGYEGAGTLEFLLDPEGRFWFMEMNTRLQVEHPVTEAITGLDLVEWQLRVAAGEALPLRQDEIAFAGHAIEVRLCAEDARHGFMPQSGTMRGWRPAEGIRTDHALRPGGAIPPYYDSMIAKLVAHGATREEARRRLLLALEEMTALGVVTNQEFLGRCLAHPVFAAGEATTAFIGRNEAALTARNSEAQARATALAAWFIHRAGAANHGAAATLAPALPVALSFTLDGEPVGARVAQLSPHDFAVVIDGDDHRLAAVGSDGEGVRFVLDGVMESAAFAQDGATVDFRYRGAVWSARDLTRAPAARAGAAGGDGKVRAAMSGRVVAVEVAAGTAVTPGQPLVTLEAMKMEHVHAADIAGLVAAVTVAPGDQVAAGQVLIEIAPDSAGG
ncbi:MAG: acetyl-CoA carboxylase biotin carboxylase subunit [Aquamicrobium sp.]|uniref:acetyl/propionyl/methylcrotonyl-CoA carboxylase subunit alpha n=1 Tax=Aquamicrobium sp. TaxID=1872579 RepID=UPI00349E7757|nr:acetyl-CoA carboxylase biotin carboxylase subunit [Aquamicrobium sp.]